MRPMLFIPMLLGTIISASVTADTNIIRSAAVIPLSENDDRFWSLIDAAVTDWENIRAEYGCSVWTPDPSTQTVGTAFLQTQICSQDQQREVQQRQQNDKTQAIRDFGSAQIENRTISPEHTRQAIGALETWIAASAVYTNWESVGGPYNCSNWSPAGSGYSSSASFTQTATNCSLNQSRTVQPREQETTTGAYRNSGAQTSESRTLASQSASRSYTVTIGGWGNSGGVTGCSNWSPATSTVSSGQSFTQTATNCSQAQTRSRVERYNDHATGALVTAVNTTESRSITASSTRTAVGTKVSYLYDTNHRAVCQLLYAPPEMWAFYIGYGGKTVYSGSRCFVPGQSYRGTDGYTYTIGSVNKSGSSLTEFAVMRN